MEDIFLINESAQKGYGLDFHGKEYCGTIGKRNLSRKLTLVPAKKARDTNLKHEKNCGKIEDVTPVATLDISDDEVNRKMKTMTTTMAMAKTTDTTTTRKGKGAAMRTK